MHYNTTGLHLYAACTFSTPTTFFLVSFTLSDQFKSLKVQVSVHAISSLYAVFSSLPSLQMNTYDFVCEALSALFEAITTEHLGEKGYKKHSGPHHFEISAIVVAGNFSKAHLVATDVQKAG